MLGVLAYLPAVFYDSISVDMQLEKPVLYFQRELNGEPLVRVGMRGRGSRHERRAADPTRSVLVQRERPALTVAAAHPPSAQVPFVNVTFTHVMVRDAYTAFEIGAWRGRAGW